MKPCEIDFRPWDKRGQLCDEVQGIEYQMGRAITVGCLDLIADVAGRRQRQALAA